MKPKIVIEIKGGSIIFIGTNTEDVTITIIDHDWEEIAKTDYEPDSVMTPEGLNDYIEKADK